MLINNQPHLKLLKSKIKIIIKKHPNLGVSLLNLKSIKFELKQSMIQKLYTQDTQRP